MAKAAMYRESLERYLLSKIWDVTDRVERVHVKRVSEGRSGDWVLDYCEPPLPKDVMDALAAKVVEPLRHEIALND